MSAYSEWFLYRRGRGIYTQGVMTPINQRFMVIMIDDIESS